MSWPAWLLIRCDMRTICVVLSKMLCLCLAPHQHLNGLFRFSVRCTWHFHVLPGLLIVLLIRMIEISCTKNWTSSSVTLVKCSKKHGLPTSVRIIIQFVTLYSKLAWCWIYPPKTHPQFTHPLSPKKLTVHNHQLILFLLHILSTYS